MVSPRLTRELDNIVEVQLVVINANAQRYDQINPSEQRVVKENIAQYIFILAGVKGSHIGMQSADFIFKSLIWDRIFF